jgi:hypothetical protein
MIGNLLRADKSIAFSYAQVGQAVRVPTNGFTSAVNANVAENNSPLPEDRVFFRYNFFHNAEFVGGPAGAPVFDPVTGLMLSPIVTKNYDVNTFTFGFEKTFLDRRASVELRVPFSTGLASRLDLSAGTVGSATTDALGNTTDASGNPFFNVNSTPQNTVGHDDTEFGDMTLIFKGLVYRGPCLAITGGTALGIPTGQNTRVHVTDFIGFGTDPLSIVRTRDFNIDNDVWSLSPFLAFLATPTERLFAQGFLEFDFPLNDDKLTYSERVLNSSGNPANTDAVITTNGQAIPPFTESHNLEDQILMHVDVGLGYWLLRNPSATWVTGIAPTLELHYTTTLENAKIVTLTNDFSQVFDPHGASQPSPAPQVGNSRGRVDILDLTVGTTFEIANRTTLATAFSFPLLGGDNRTYDWEFQFQLNYYFGASRNRQAPAF